MASDQSFRDWLKQRRKSLDLTQKELALQAGCSIYTVQRIEEGVLRPSRQLADLLAAGLEVPPEERPAFVRWARMPASMSSTGVETAVTATPSEGPVPTSSPLGNGSAASREAPQVTNPYKGLRAFHEADAPDFFGREALSQRLRERLDEETELARFLAVVGPSGSGKSSVVRAGLVPALRHQALPGGLSPVMVDMVPGARPLEELEAALLRVAVNPPSSLIEQLREDERGLARAVKRVLPGDDQTELVLVIDQFEELFTLVEDEEVRADFLDSLFSAVTDPRSRLWVVITLRADFYDRPLLYLPSSELLGRRTEVVGPLTPNEMYQAITGPAERVGLELERDLVATIMQDVAEQPGTLPLLQYTLTELYERREGRLLTLAAYRASGGVFGSLALRAESLYAGLTGPEQAAARQLFLRLVTLGEGVEDTRRRVLMSELVSVAEAKANQEKEEGALHRVLDLFGRYRMLTFDRNPLTREPTVEVAHEALLRTWGRLREWLEESREDLHVQRRLMSSASEWRASGQQPSYLTSGSRLAQFEGLAAHAADSGGVALTGEEQAYLAASQEDERRQEKAEQERHTRELALQKRAASRLRYLAGALGLFLIVATVLTAFAFSQQVEANAQRREAQNSATLAQSSAATAVANEGEANRQREQARANLARSEAQRLAAEANTLLETGGGNELIALLALRSMRTQYSPQGDAALEAAALLEYPHQQYSGHTDQLNGVAFSPDGKYVLSGGSAGVPRLWDAETGKELRQLPRFTGQIAGTARVVFSPDSKYALIGSWAARLWDIETGEELHRFTDITMGARAPEFSPDGKQAVIGDGGGVVHVLDMQALKELRRFTAHEAPIWGIAYSPDGKYVVTGSADKTAVLWDVETGEEVQRFTGHTDTFYKVAYSPDGKYVLTPGSSDGTARLWDVQTGQELRVLTGHTNWVNDVAFSPDGMYALTGSDDRTARLWDVQTGKEVHRFTNHSAEVKSVDYSPDGKYILTGSIDGTLFSWDVEPDAGLPRFVGHSDWVGNALYSPDGNHVLTSSGDNTVRLWDAKSGKEVLRLTDVHIPEDHSIAYSRDGKYVLTSGDDKTPRLWDVQTGKELRVLTGHTESTVYSVAFSPDGKVLATGGFDMTARLWDTETGKELHVLDHLGQVFGVSFSPDGKHLITGSQDELAHVWDVETGEKVRTFEGHSEGVAAVAYSPDGKQVLTGSDDKTARLWDAETGEQLRSFIGHTGWVTGVAFSPDAKQTLTASADGTVRLWDTQTGQERRRLSSRSGPLNSAAFSPDGKYILTGSEDKTARVWHTDYRDTVQYLCGQLLRDFTDAERAQFNISDKEPTCPKP